MGQGEGGRTRLDMDARVRPALAGFEPYDPAFTPCEVNLSANENTHALPEAVRAAIEEAALSTPLNRYPDPLANDLRDVLAKRHGVARENIMVGNGGDEVLFNLLFAFGGAGRSLVVAPPCFEEYKNFAKMCEVEVREVWRDADDFSLDVDGLVEASRDASIVMLTSPNNPTGDLVDRGVVERLLEASDALILVDEAYVEFAGEDASLVAWAQGEPRVMVLRTLSKAFALAGMRVGYLVADPAIVDVLAAIRQIYSVDVVAQAVAIAAVERRSEMEAVVADIVWERARLERELSALPGVRVWPSAANFLLCRVPQAALVRARLRDEHSVLVRDFSYAKGLEGCLRVSVGTAAENDRLIDCLGRVLQTLD